MDEGTFQNNYKYWCYHVHFTFLVILSIQHEYYWCAWLERMDYGVDVARVY